MLSYEREPGWLVGLQVGAAALVVLILLPVGVGQAVAAVAGGAVVVLPNAWFAWMTGRAEQALSVLAYALIKFVMVVSSAGVVLALLEVEPLGFFAAFGMALLAQMIGPFAHLGGGKSAGRG